MNAETRTAATSGDIQEDDRATIRRWRAEAGRLGLSRTAFFFSAAEEHILRLMDETRRTNVKPAKPSPFVYTMQ